jgi:ribosomal protein L11 methyltransferase
MKKYIKIEIEIESEEEAQILVALLTEINFYAFEDEQDLLVAYIREEDFDENLIVMTLPEKRPFKKYVIDEKNWNYQWEQTITPVIVNDFVALHPSFTPANNNVKIDIIITPKMSFGTGHHATTYLMIQQMQQIDFMKKHVMDFGTGTGVLAILAHQLGAGSVVAIDNDEWSIENAKENFARNNADDIDLRLANHPAADKTCDIILANITRNVIQENFALLYQYLNNHGILLLSGLLSEDENLIASLASTFNFATGKKLQKGNWISIRLIKQES